MLRIFLAWLKRPKKLKTLEKALHRHRRRYGSLPENARQVEDAAETYKTKRERHLDVQRFERVFCALCERFENNAITDDFCNLRRDGQSPVHAREFVPEDLRAKTDLKTPIVPISEVLAITCPGEKCGKSIVVWSVPAYNQYGEQISDREYFGICRHCGKITKIPAGDLSRIIPPSIEPSF